MIKKFRFFLLFLGLSFCLACVNTKKINHILTKKHEPAELIKDVDLTYKFLTKGHPGVYWYIDKQKLDFKFDSLKKSLTTPLTTKEFYLKLAPLVTEIKCGHTQMILTSKFESKKEKDSLAQLIKPIKQFDLKIIKEKLYITSFNKKHNQLKKGDEIVSINDIKFKNIYDSLANYITTDGYNKTHKTFTLNKGFKSYFSVIYDDIDTLDFKIKRADSIFNLKVITLKKEKNKDISKQDTTIKKLSKDSLLAFKKIDKERKKAKYKGFDEFKKPILDLKFLEKDSSTALLKIKSFSFPKANFKRFYDESFSAIKKGKTKNLIIDLRDNTGGYSYAVVDLFSYLVDKEFIFYKKSEVNNKFNSYWEGGYGKSRYLMGFKLFILSSKLLKKENEKYKVQSYGNKLKKTNSNHYDGKIFVLINGGTFSASSLLSSNLKQLNRATFVGEETGGAFNGCVASFSMPGIFMPKSLVYLKMALYPYIPNVQIDTIGRGIFPDVEITPTIEDVLAGKDKELEWVLKNIKN
ncbi:MAG: hypothetical protein K2Q03_07850 [Sphingobacteriaceae bacterium]|nr:hypothetical protein [Sphingobacteriaceae bacterium]